LGLNISKDSKILPLALPNAMRAEIERLIEQDFDTLAQFIKRAALKEIQVKRKQRGEPAFVLPAIYARSTKGNSLKSLKPKHPTLSE
jgi:hypothetical protein